MRSDLGQLAPTFRAAIQWLEWRLEHEGVPMVRFETFRSYSRQQQLFESGSFTNANAGQSPHNHGLAVDYVLDVAEIDVARRSYRGRLHPDGWDRATPAAGDAWRKFGEIVESIGLVWGGRFSHPNGRAIDEYGFGWDLPHVEAPAWRSWATT